MRHAFRVLSDDVSERNPEARLRVVLESTPTARVSSVTLHPRGGHAIVLTTEGELDEVLAALVAHGFLPVI